MDLSTTHAIQESAALSLAGQLTFPELLQRLSRAGVERYHADYTRQEITYYLATGESVVVSTSHTAHPTGKTFDARAVADAVKQSQRNEHSYADFVRKTMAAGCVGYFVQITGQKVLYFGRNGECHIERFPTAIAAKPKVTGLLETALAVSNVEQSAAFYERLFGFPRLLTTERLIALDVVGRDVLLLFLKGVTEDPFTLPGGVIPGHGSSGRHHLAFSVTADEIPAWKRRLEDERVAVESVVTWPGGAESVYFRDPDQHLLELITPGFWATY